MAGALEVQHRGVRIERNRFNARRAAHVAAAGDKLRASRNPVDPPRGSAVATVEFKGREKQSAARVERDRRAVVSRAAAVAERPEQPLLHPPLVGVRRVLGQEGAVVERTVERAYRRGATDVHAAVEVAEA